MFTGQVSLCLVRNLTGRRLGKGRFKYIHSSRHQMEVRDWFQAQVTLSPGKLTLVTTRGFM
jgi:hypothetical protein